MGNKADLKKLVDLAVNSFGKVDILVSNAAVNPAAGLILDMPDSAIDKILDVNVKSAILLSKEVRPHLQKVHVHQLLCLHLRVKLKMQCSHLSLSNICCDKNL